MTWSQPGSKPLLKTMMTQFTDAQRHQHYSDIIMSTMAFQITSLTIVYSTVYLGADQRKHQSFTSLAFVQGIHRWPVNSPHKGPIMRKKFPFDDCVMKNPTKSCQPTSGRRVFLLSINSMKALAPCIGARSVSWKRRGQIHEFLGLFFNPTEFCSIKR